MKFANMLSALLLFALAHPSNGAGRIGPWNPWECVNGIDTATGKPCIGNTPMGQKFPDQKSCQQSCHGQCIMNPLQTDDKTPASSWFCQMWVVGRPYTYANDVLLSQLVEGDSEWTRHQEQGDWDLDSIPDHLKKDISDQWLEAGLHEHASVASFNRQGIALMANGGPAKLVGDALTGALDEIDHAKRSFAIGSGVGGRSFGPGPFPEHQNAHYFNLTHLALTTLEEGGVGETRAAARAAFQAKVSVHPGLRANYEQIRDDEARHAATAWQTISWIVAKEPAVAAKLQALYEQKVGIIGDGKREALSGINSERAQYGLFDDNELVKVQQAAKPLIDSIAARAFSGKLDMNDAGLGEAIASYW